MATSPSLTPERWTIAVLMGGQSAEAEISRSSAREVSAALNSRGHQARLLELDENITRELLAMAPDLVFPALHGPPGEDGTVQGYLEILGLPYVGSGVHGSAIAMDKDISKGVYRKAGLPVARDLVFRSLDDLQRVKQQIQDQIGTEMVIKPLRQGSALGITRLFTAEQLTPALEAAHAFDGGILVEEFIHGREITVGVLDLHDQPTQVFPVIEIRTAQGQWYNFTNRYQAGASEHLIPAPLPEATSRQLQSIALLAHEYLGLQDLSRSDFIVTQQNEIYLLETNTLPGMTPTSLYPDGARALDIRFDELVERLSASALNRSR